MVEGNVLFIANPAAQNGNGATGATIAYDLLCDWLGEDHVDFRLTKAPSHATELARKLDPNAYSTVFALGGDGIAHEVINGLMTFPQDERPTFGLIPMGSGNDYAKTLGMSLSVPEAIVQFLDADVKALDIGLCNGVYFDETLSFGLDAAIALDTMERRKRTGRQGTLLYLSSGIDQLLHHLDTFEVHAVLDDDRVIEGSMHLFAVQNGPTYGGGFRICPQADPADGLFDICYADAPMKLVEATFKFLSAKSAHHTKMKGIHFDRASKLQISFDRIPPCQIDGEPLPAQSYEITMEHHALDVLVPRKDTEKL